MPATSPKQQRFFGMIYGWEKAHGGRTKPGYPPMSVAKEFAAKPKGGYKKK